MADFDSLGALVRSEYREACHGAGAAARWKARDELDRVAKDGATTTPDLLRRYNLDLTAYFASCPISRPEPAAAPFVDVSYETLPDGSQPIRLSNSIRVF